MKAIILAGGKGIRGKPYTEYFPKSMIPLNGKPIIDYVVGYLDSLNLISEIIIVSDLKGLGGQIQNYLEKKPTKKRITFVQDSQSGTGGDLLHITKNLKNTSEFLLWFSDNLCAIDLKNFYKKFKEKKGLACIATRVKRKEETGFAIVKDDIITEFREKPTINLPMSECLGIYLLDTKILKKIKSTTKSKKINFSYDILSNLVRSKKVSAFNIGEKLWMDIESPVLLERNKHLVRKITKQMGF